MPNFLNNKKQNSGEESKSSDKNKRSKGALRMNLIGGEMANVFDWYKGLSIIFSALIFCLILVVISYGVIFWRGKTNLQNTKKEMAEKYDVGALNQNIGNTKEKINKEVLPFQKKVEGAEILIDEHIYWNNFFQFLEDHTLSSVHYSGFSGNLSGEYTLEARADDIEAVEAQIEEFLNEEEFVRNAWVKQVSSKPTEGGRMVSFSINLFLKSPFIFTNYQ